VIGLRVHFEKQISEDAVHNQDANYFQKRQTHGKTIVIFLEAGRDPSANTVFCFGE
jgi:hypothetical protein